MREASLNWIVTQCRFKPRTQEVLKLVWVEGLSRPGAARYLSVRTSTVQKLEGRAKHKMERIYQQAGPGERALWESMFEEEDESLPLDTSGRVAAVLSVMRGPRPHAPTSPEYDELGREIARRPPLVSLNEAIAAVRAADQERGRSRSVPLWRSNYG